MTNIADEAGAGRSPVPPSGDAIPVSGRPQSGGRSPLELFDRYAREARLAPATVRRWRAVMAKAQEECPRMADITPEWCEGWKQRLVESGLSPRTVENVHLAGLRALCRWAVANGEIVTNPMDGITISVTRSEPTRFKGFLDTEVQTILSATLEPAPATFRPRHSAARRWIPWLATYTGARIREIAVLRNEDVIQSNGIWVVRFAGDDGYRRVSRFRVVPLHPHLVEQGFPDFVKESGVGPMF